MYQLTVPRPRGCGERKPGGLYACCASSPLGQPIEHFLHCPPIAHDEKFHRTPKVSEEGDLLIWVGKEFYPWPSDFIEEAREQGVSRRIPNNYSLENLAPGARMRLVHANAIFGGLAPEVYEAPDEYVRLRPFPTPVPFCPKDRREHWQTGEEDFAPCLGRSYQVAPPAKVRGAVMTPAEESWRTIGSTHYRVFPATIPEEWEPRFYPGLFATFPLTHFEYVNSPDPARNEQMKEKMRTSRVPIAVVEK